MEYFSISKVIRFAMPEACSKQQPYASCFCVSCTLRSMKRVMLGYDHVTGIVCLRAPAPCRKCKDRLREDDYKWLQPFLRMRVNVLPTPVRLRVLHWQLCLCKCDFCTLCNISEILEGLVRWPLRFNSKMGPMYLS